MHVAATYLVFLLCLRLTGSVVGAAVGAALFAVHPVHVDAVTWVSASNEVLFTILALSSVLLLAKKSGDRLYLWGSAGLFCAALFSKETGVVLLPVVIGVAWAQSEGSTDDGTMRRLWKVSAPYLVATVAYIVARGFALSGVNTGKNQHSWAEVAFTSPSIVLFYLKKLILPLGLSPCYLNTLAAKPTADFWITLTGILLGTGGVAWMAIQRRSRVGVAAAWILLPILPALFVLRLYPQGDMTHDRYLYAPSVGLSLLAAMFVAYLCSRYGRKARQMVVATAVVLVCGFAGLTFAQQKYYDDDLAFYHRAIEVNPSNGIAYSALGDIYLDQGLTDRALENHRRAHELAPDDAQVTLLLARALFVAKKSSEAEAVLHELLRDPGLAPQHRVSALLSLANIEISLQHLELASELLGEVEKENPATPELHWAKGILFQREGLLAQAQAEYEKEYQITGDSAAQRQAALLARKNFQSAGANGNSTDSSSTPVR